ncbi:ribosomal protein L11 methyltransferase [Melioribacter roseus P3M-2]|uniref:Ribosomal protein L11 methyltransferase n=1 Tax=Melioribacter roseus (strain DSM 23840 / JCM 17771 / VKM B-2668 / P3M-2) TaxID=1191523 RepID=I6Z6A2_MELRP|nr:50S ribosomal protein L11 methyltransferase [Melioribacter roseus]AFN74690.1 ribosomal protein L11 methyltransferase [Melioribacter roseus P3M-2]
MKTYKQVNITSIPRNYELLSGLLWDLPIEGINETDTSLIIYYDASNRISIEEFKKVLDEAVRNNLIESYEISESEVENKNWNEEYEKNVRVIEVTDKIVIKPSFKEYNSRGDQIVITIDPKMSFGTGEHQTTRLMIEMIEKYVSPGAAALDVGTGTGVLAIAAVKLGAERALGIDNDEWCYLNGNENIVLNNVEERVKIIHGEITDIEDEQFDIVLANINKNILIEIADEIKKKVKKTGLAILSGLLNADENDIDNRYVNVGFRPVDKKSMGEWLSIVYRSDR